MLIHFKKSTRGQTSIVCDKITIYSKTHILIPPLGLSKSGLKDHFWTVPMVVSIKESFMIGETSVVTTSVICNVPIHERSSKPAWSLRLLHLKCVTPVVRVCRTTDLFKTKQYIFVKHEYVPRWRSRSQVIFCTSGKPLSQGTYMSNMKALSERIQNLWPMLKWLKCYE